MRLLNLWYGLLEFGTPDRMPASDSAQENDAELNVPHSILSTVTIRQQSAASPDSQLPDWYVGSLATFKSHRYSTTSIVQVLHYSSWGNTGYYDEALQTTMLCIF